MNFEIPLFKLVGVYLLFYLFIFKIIYFLKCNSKMPTNTVQDLPGQGTEFLFKRQIFLLPFFFFFSILSRSEILLFKSGRRKRMQVLKQHGEGQDCLFFSLVYLSPG